mmetsp:Transcript_67106/g.108800  ORF Transcript_67106/g.108800 Transcript_67106/m.108800 type:complete len:504 (+) Transcript_67106:647-2158(+)
MTVTMTALSTWGWSKETFCRRHTFYSAGKSFKSLSLAFQQLRPIFYDFSIPKFTCGAWAYVVMRVCQRDPEWLRYHHAHVDGFHQRRTVKKRHKNCSPASCICDMPASHNKGSNASLAEQKNSKNRMLAALLPHLAQDAAHDILQVHSKMINQLQILVNLEHEFRTGIKRCPDEQPSFVVDAINLPRVATMTFYQRDHLETGMQTRRQGNPNPLKKRVMIYKRHLKDVFKRFCDTSNNDKFPFISYDDKVQECLDFLRDSRPLFYKILEFDKKYPDATTPSASKSSKPLKIKLHSKLMSVKDLLLHWCSKNHETHLILPQFACLLQPFLSKDRIHTQKDFNLLQGTAPKTLTSLVAYRTIKVEENKFQMQEDVQNLLRFALRLQIADTTVIDEPCNIRSNFAPRLDTLHGKDLPTITTAARLDYFSPTVTHADSVWVGASWMRPKPSGPATMFSSIAISLLDGNHLMHLTRILPKCIPVHGSTTKIRQHCLHQDLIEMMALKI